MPNYIRLGELDSYKAFNRNNYAIFTTPSGSKKIAQENILNLIVEPSAAGHSIYRGKYLGTSVSDEAYAAIAAGTFDPEDTGGLFVGDYWTINGINWRIAHPDYWYNFGDTACDTHHLVIVPDTILYSGKMNETNITTGAYVGSAMYISGLEQAKTIVNAAFGPSHVLTHREHLQNAVTNGYASAGTWYNSTVELMSEEMVYGGREYEPGNSLGATIPNLYKIDHSQLKLFELDRSKICNRSYWWLRSLVSSTDFAYVHNDSDCNNSYASNLLGVRPAFGIKAAS
jgi:hypothetical protein